MVSISILASNAPMKQVLSGGAPIGLTSSEGNTLQKQLNVLIASSQFQDRKKKTDVNISVRMMADCVQGKVDSVVLISADTDLIPPLDFIYENCKSIKIKVYFPPSNFSHDIKDFGKARNIKVKELVNNIDRFFRSKMDDTVGEFSIPDEWKRKHAGANPYFEKPKTTL